jgi:hypothetical protein
VNWARAFFGIIVVLIGSILLLDNLDVLDAGEVISDWWPVAIIAGGVLAFIANPRHWVMPLILVGGGAFVLLRTTGAIDTVEVLLPAALIVVGLLVLFGRGLGTQSATTDDQVNTFNLFSGSEMASNSTNFRGGRIGAIFGGAELDLSNATLSPDAGLDIFAAFGGVEITVPHGWRVDINGFPLFGGFENKTAKERLAEDAPRLRIDATVLFGGLEVKH